MLSTRKPSPPAVCCCTKEEIVAKIVNSHYGSTYANKQCPTRQENRKEKPIPSHPITSYPIQSHAAEPGGFIPALTQ